MRFALPFILNLSLARNLPRLLPPRRSRGGLRVGNWAAVALLAASPLLAVVPLARAQDALTALYSFSATDSNGLNTDGDGPTNLIMGSDGNFYGTTIYGGSAGVGTIYRLTPGGELTTLYTFTGGSDNGFPFGRLYRTDDGSLYGTTTGVGNTNGTIFQLTPALALNTLYAFTGGSDGANPFGGLVPNPDGYLYSTTPNGGTNNRGVIFRIAPAGTGFQVVYAFTGGNDGSSPQATMLLASDGNFYGENLTGGANGFGTIYQFNPTTNALNTLYTFTSGNSSVGAGAVGLLVEGPGKVLYGLAGRGGDANNDGDVFSITTGGTYSLLYSFTGGADGSQPFNGLIFGRDGNLYGATERGGTNNDGVLFRLPTSGGTPTTLYTFSAESNTVNPEGYNPNGSLIQVGGGFYGLAFRGGSGGSGTFFELVFASAGSVQLSAATDTVLESAGSVMLAVSRTGGSTGAISVNYATADATAVAGTDYQATSGTLSWADGDATAKTITVPVTNRNLTAGSTLFLVNLSAPGGGAALASPTQAAVTILDTPSSANLQSVTLLSPPAGVTLTVNQPVVLQADAEALAGTLANVEFFAIDAGGNMIALGRTTSGRGQVDWTPAAAGSYTLQVVATDSSGNTQQATSTVTVVATGAATPQTTLQAGLDGITVPLGATVPVAAQAVDSAGNALQNVQFYLDGVPVSSAPVTAIKKADRKAADATAGTLFIANIIASKVQQLLTVVGTTASGVSSVSTAATIYGKAQAGTPPTAIISNLASGASVPGTAGQSVSVAASSGSQPIAKVQLVVDSQSVGVATAVPYTFSLPSLAAGAHVLSIIATDIGALSSVSTPVVVTAQQAGTSTPAFFTGEVALANGVYYLAFPNGNFFGYYSFLPNPAYLYHFDLGFEYVFDAADGKSGVYFYDFASSTFFYTSPSFPFPYLYDFTLNSVLYYYPDPNNAGHYNTEGVRYFYDFNSQQIISK